MNQQKLKKEKKKLNLAMYVFPLKNIWSKRLSLTIIMIMIVYALLPIRFAVVYEYIKDEEIQYHFVLSSKPSNGSCPTLPKLNTNQYYFDGKLLYEKNDTTLATDFAIQKGGLWKPKYCSHVHDVALVVPFRGRPKQLHTFLHYIHPFLQKQLISYRIFVIEQTYLKAFNRGLLLNVGFLEALKIHQFHCFIFHDVDLLPMVELNMYACSEKPRHLCPAINTWRFNLKYETAFGGVIAILKDQFLKINGFSNKYFGWGGEDDDLMERILGMQLGYLRFSQEISKYHMLHHKPEEKNPERLQHLVRARMRFQSDGINSINYTKLVHDEKPLYTHIVVDPI